MKLHSIQIPILTEMARENILIASIPVGYGIHFMATCWALTRTGAVQRGKHITPSKPIIFVIDRGLHAQVARQCSTLGIPSMICESKKQIKAFSELLRPTRYADIPGKIYITSKPNMTQYRFGALVTDGYNGNVSEWFRDHPISENRLCLVGGGSTVSIYGISKFIAEAQVGGIESLLSQI